ncbi:MAG: hypothetical protein ACYS0F_01780 [Planctomycetota bacterium]
MCDPTNEGELVGAARVGVCLVRGWVVGRVGVLGLVLRVVSPRAARFRSSRLSEPKRRARNSRVDMPAARVGVARGVKMPEPDDVLFVAEEVCATLRVGELERERLR